MKRYNEKDIIRYVQDIRFQRKILYYEINSFATLLRNRVIYHIDNLLF